MKVVVVGGGLSGLFTATALTAAGLDEVVVLEKSEQPGGVARTIRRDGFTLDPAVGAVTLPHPHLGPLLERIGVEMVGAHPSASIRQVYLDGRLHSIRASPKAVTTPIISWPAKLRAAAEPLIPAGSVANESLGDFCRRRFGRRAGNMVAWLMASGVFAGDPEQMSAQGAFPTLIELEREFGSVIRGAIARRRQRDPNSRRPRLHYPARGMEELAQRAAEALGDRYRGGFPVESVRQENDVWVVSGEETLRADAVVLATSPPDAARVVDDELGDHLGEASSARVVVVGLGGPGEEVLPSGFGALVGPDEGMTSRGFLYESSYAPEKAPEGTWLLKVVAGGAPFEDRLWDDVVSTVISEAETLLRTSLDTTFVEVVDDVAGIPQYGLGHVRWLKQLDRLVAERPGLHLTGWGYRGIGAAHLASDAVRISRDIAS